MIPKELGLDCKPEDPSRGATLGDRVRKDSRHRAYKVDSHGQGWPHRVSFLLGKGGLTAWARVASVASCLGCVLAFLRSGTNQVSTLVGSSGDNDGGGVFGGRVDDGAGERRDGSHGGRTGRGRVGIGKYPRLLIPRKCVE